jgi:hypothetical protein
MQVNVKDALSARTTVIDRLHCPCERFAANPGTDSMIFNVLVIRDGMIPSKQNQAIIVHQRTQATKHKSDALRRKWMRSCQITDYSDVERAA